MLIRAALLRALSVVNSHFQTRHVPTYYSFRILGKIKQFHFLLKHFNKFYTKKINTLAKIRCLDALQLLPLWLKLKADSYLFPNQLLGLRLPKTTKLFKTLQYNLSSQGVILKPLLYSVVLNGLKSNRLSNPRWKAGWVGTCLHICITLGHRQ